MHEELPLYAVADEPEPRFQWREAFRHLACSPAAVVTMAPARPARAALLLDAARPDAEPGVVVRGWAVRRLAVVGVTDAALALADAEGVAGPAGALDLSGSSLRWVGDEFRRMGVLRGRWRGRPVLVEAVAAPWSTSRTELVLLPRCASRRLHLPTRYFDAAHDAVDALRRHVEAATGS
jgi:hypothetical protein